MVVSLSVLGIKSMNEICFLSMGLFQTFLQSISFYNMAAKAITCININGNLNQRTKQLPVPKVFYHLSSKKYKT